MNAQQVGRRAARALVAAVVLGGLAVAPASATPVEDGHGSEELCRTAPQVPARISIDAVSKDVAVGLDRCGGSDEYLLDLAGPRGIRTAVLVPEGAASTGTWEVGLEYPVGRWTFSGDLDQDPDVEVTPVTVALKYGARASLRGSRSGDDVTLRVQASSFDASKASFQPLRDGRATIEILGKDGRTWQYLRSVTVPRTGLVDHTFTNRYAATYRVTTWETPYIWSRTSQAVTVPGR